MIINSGHSIIIDGKDTYNAWGLIPAERPSVNPPTIKSSFLEIPGSNSSIDLTTMLRGQVSYGQRIGSWKFYMDPDWPGASVGDLRQRRNNGTLWAYIYNSLINYIHGQKHNLILSDAPTTQYTGRLSLSDWKTGKNYSEITISYNLNPFTQTVN